MREVRIDLAPFADKQSLHCYLKEALDLPGYYGSNLDALHDELISIGETVKITVSVPKAPAGDMADYIPKLLEVFREAGSLNYNLKVEIDQPTGRKKQNPFLQEVYAFLKDAGTYYLATSEGDQPRVRPFGTVDLFEDRLYIQTGKSKSVSMQIQENPKVELCAFKGGKWLRLAGELVQDDRYEAKKHMLDAYPELKKMYSPEDENTEVLYFQNARAAFYSFSESTQEGVF